MAGPPPAEATLVLLHPVGLDGGSFSFLAPFLDLGGARAPSLLGHGGRPRSPGMTLADVADDVAASVPGRLDLAGFSFGAMVALQVALRHPERVRSLLFACAPATVDPAVMLGRAGSAEAGMAGVVDSTLARWFTPAALEAPGHPGVAYSRSSLLGLDPLAFADGWRAIAGHDARPALGRLRLPLTCLAGSRDVSAPPEQVREVARGVAGARYVVIDAPHIAYLEEPAAVAAVISEHLATAADREP